MALDYWLGRLIEVERSRGPGMLGEHHHRVPDAGHELIGLEA